MKMDIKVILTVMAVAVIAVMFLTYLCYNDSNSDPQIKEIEVGDYIVLESTQVSEQTTTQTTSLEFFYGDTFTADLDTMEYVQDANYIVNDKTILCEVYQNEDQSAVVYVVKTSKIMVYKELAFGGVSMSTMLVDCSLDVEAGFYAEYLVPGTTMDFSSITESTINIQAISHCTIDDLDVEEGEITYTSEVNSTLNTEIEYEVAEIDGDNLIMTNGSELSKEDFLSVLSKERMYESLTSSYTITSEKTEAAEIETDFGTFDGTTLSIHGNDDTKEMDMDINYVGDDIFLNMDGKIYSETMEAYVTIKIADTNMII